MPNTSIFYSQLNIWIPNHLLSTEYLITYYFILSLISEYLLYCQWGILIPNTLFLTECLNTLFSAFYSEITTLNLVLFVEWKWKSIQFWNYNTQGKWGEICMDLYDHFRVWQQPNIKLWTTVRRPSFLIPFEENFQR